MGKVAWPAGVPSAFGLAEAGRTQRGGVQQVQLGGPQPEHCLEARREELARWVEEQRSGSRVACGS